MRAAERRSEIMKILCRRRYESISNLASEFGVSQRTIQRDIEVMSFTNPIYTKCGRYGGGVYLVDGFSADRIYMKDDELDVLKKLSVLADQNQDMLLPEEKRILRALIANYTVPGA